MKTLLSDRAGQMLDEQSELLKREAEKIIRDLMLLEILNQYGEAQVVGSVALDLIMKRDIDIHFVVNTPDLFGVVDRVYHQLLEAEHIREVRISDYRDHSGVKIGIDAYPAASGNWSIDIWITNYVEATGFELVSRLKQELSPEHREAILRIKHEYHRKGKLRDGLSTLIYKAVVDKGVRTEEGFAQLLSGLRNETQ